MSIGMKIEANILITITGPKFDGKSLIAWGPPISLSIKIESPKSFNISMNFTSTLMIDPMFSIILIAMFVLVKTFVISVKIGLLATFSIHFIRESLIPGYFLGKPSKKKGLTFV